MYLYLIRHGQTAWNDQGRLQGNIDTQLDETGLKQAESAGKRLAKYPIKYIYSSDLQRAVHTAEIINRFLQAEMIIEPGLREIRYGEWEGKKWEEISDYYATYIQKWRQDRVNIPAPGGESFRDLEKRLLSIVTRITARNTEHLAIVTHSGVIKALICMFLDIPLENQAKLSFKNCSISIVKLTPEKKLSQVVCLNDSAHLET